MASWAGAAEAEVESARGVGSRYPAATGGSIARGEASEAGRVRREASPTTERPGNAPITGVIPTIDDASPAAVDAARLLLASLQHRDNEGGLPSRLGFTSALYGEGVSFISRTVATVLAHDFRERVCLVDLNWGQEAAPRATTLRRKRKARRLEAELTRSEPTVGLADALRRTASLRDVILETEDPRLTLVAAGAASPAEGQIFARSERLSQIIEALERHNDHLIFDLPPVLVSSAVVPLARQAGSVALVVHQGVTSEAQVREAFDRLGQVPSVGVVLNRASSKIPRPLLRRLSNW
jgi:Mrp family chromosome partitioning ATPase